MKLRGKAIIIIALVEAIFIAITLVSDIRFSLINFLILVGLTSLLMFFLFRDFIFKRIDELNQKVKLINEKNRATQHIEIKGNDEISSITIQINRLLDKINESHENLKQIEIMRIQELQNINERLKSELGNRLSIENKASDRTEMLSQLAHYDNLTSLPNRIFFNEILNKAISHAKRRKKICAILFINLDSFKTINSKLGNTAGDYILKEMSNRFTNTLRAEDILARLDGDEFIVLLNDINKPKFASTVAEKLLQTCAIPIQIGPEELSLKASIGICIYPNDGVSLEDLLKNGALTLEKVKQAGGNGYQFYTQKMNIEAHEFIQLEAALHKAIQRNELSLYYQPKLDIKRGKINGVEALIRWIHPTLGTINPAQLIQIAEETGLSMQVAEWALREGCQMNKHWQNEGYEHITVAVNLSPKQFYHPDLGKIITDALQISGLNPKYLELEINESTVMDDIQTSHNAFDRIKSIGVQFSIDHFGTGYTSISHLKHFPINAIKIDQSFIKGLPHNPNDSAIINAFIALAHNLGLEIVAEGVETAEQVQYLSEHNCDMVQGYFLSHPLPAQKIIAQFIKLGEEVLF